MSVYLYLPRSEPHNIRVVTSRYPIERAFTMLPNHLRGTYVFIGNCRLNILNPQAMFIKVPDNVEQCYNLGDF